MGILTVFCFTACAIPTAERDALMRLYASTEGPSFWSVSTRWGEGDPCDNSWAGITCTGGANVMQISLGSNNLHGMLPNNFTLPFLEIL